MWLNTSVHLGSGVTIPRFVHRPREVMRRLRELARHSTDLTEIAE